MRAQVAVVAAATILATGCQQDPETSSLEPGAEVVIVKTEPDGGDEVPVRVRPGFGQMGGDLTMVKIGTTCRVVSDPGGANPKRQIEVNVKAEYKEFAGALERDFLRPVP